MTSRSGLNAIVSLDEVITSSEAAKRLSARGRSGVASRQHIARAAKGSELWRSEALQLPNRQRLLAHRSFVGTPRFLRQAEGILAETRPGVSRCLAALRHRRVVLKPDAERLLGGQDGRSYPRDSDALKELGIIHEDVGTALERFAMPSAGDTRSLAQGHYHRLVRSALVARLVVEHLRRLSIISWGGNVLSDGPLKLARFSGYPFSAFGWSWLSPLLTWGSHTASPAPVLIDVFTTTCDTFDVEAFSYRLRRATGRLGRSPIGAISARRFTNSAHKLARRQGLVTIPLGEIFGEAALDLMAEVSMLLSSIPDEDADHAQSVDALAASLTQLDEHPFVQELRSLGFETLAALLARSEGWEDVKVGTTVTHEQTSREIDVCGMRQSGRSVLLVECKARRRSGVLRVEEVNKFFLEVVPAFLKHNHNFQVENCSAEIWTSGGVGADAELALASIKLDRRVAPALVDGSRVESRLPQTLAPCKRLLRTIAQE